MMKRLFVLAALAACGKPNDVATLHHEAVAVASYYQPKLDALDKRVQTIFKRGTTIPANLPGIEEVGKRLTEARDAIVQMRGIIQPGPDGKNAVQKQADLAAKDRKVDDLRKLVHDTEATLEEGTTIANEDLDSVESWIALYDQGINRAGGAEVKLGTPPPVPEQPGAAPGNTTTPPTEDQTRQPPAPQPEPGASGAAAGSAAAGAGKGGAPAAAAPKAGAPATAAPKAGAAKGGTAGAAGAGGAGHGSAAAPAAGSAAH